MDAKKSVLKMLGHWHEVEVAWGQSIYNINSRALVYLRYSKDQGNKFWFGVSEPIFKKYYAENFYIFFICGTQDNVIVMPSMEFYKLVEDVKPSSNGEWHINIFNKNNRYGLRVSRKGIFDVTPYLNYYDFTPPTFRKGYTPQIQGFTPIRKYEEKKEIEEVAKEEIPVSLKEKLMIASKDSKNPAEFERLVKQAFQSLGFDVELIGGAGDTDILISKPYKVIIDVKSTSKDSLSRINFTRLKQHKLLHGAEYMLIISVDFAPAVIRDAEIERASLMTVETLGKILELYEALPFSPFLLQRLFEHVGLVPSEEITYLKEQADYTQKYLSDILLVLECVDYNPRTFDEIKGRLDYRCENLEKETIPADMLREILDILSSPIFNLIRFEDLKYSSLFNFSGAKERIKSLVRYLYNPNNFRQNLAKSDTGDLK